MKLHIVQYLRCPLTGKPLILIPINYHQNNTQEVEQGFLYANNGGIYPIINGITRLLPESFLQYENQLKLWDENFESRKKSILVNFANDIQQSVEKNNKIQSTFSFEWGLLNKNDQLKIWNLNNAEYKAQLLKELNVDDNFTCQLSLDAGCGHGKSANLLAAFAGESFGIEISNAVEIGHANNNKENLHYIQASIDYLPFDKHLFDLVYCSGVLHHNASTNSSLGKLIPFVKAKGLLCIWLYHPFNNGLHKMMCLYRNVTSKLPVKLVYYINCMSLTPLHWLISQVKGKKKKFTEISIEQLDILTPAYRHEHAHDEVKKWLANYQFEKIEVTAQDDYGFSMIGFKQ